MAHIALRFGSGLDAAIEQNRRHSKSTLRILRLSCIQRWPEDKMQDWPCYFFTGPKLLCAHRLTTKFQEIVNHRSTGIRDIDFQTAQHEIEHSIEAVETEITRQGTDIVKESFASGQRGANKLIFVIHHVEHGVK